MQERLERWLIAPKSRFAIAVVLVLIIGAWTGFFLWPRAELQEGRATRPQEQWRKLLSLRAALQAIAIDEERLQAFSPVDLPVAGAALISWRPTGTGGEMQLAVNWQAVPALFSWLARCGVQITGFSMYPEKQALRLTLQLEAEDAP